MLLTNSIAGESAAGKKTDVAQKGFMCVSELAEVQEGLHHRLLQGLVSVLHCVLVPVDVPA